MADYRIDSDNYPRLRLTRVLAWVCTITIGVTVVALAIRYL